MGDDPLPGRTDDDRSAPLRGGPDRRRQPVAADLVRDPSQHPDDDHDPAHPQPRHVHGRRVREDPAALQPADVPDRRRDHDVPVPHGRRVQQFQLRRGDRAVRGPDRTGADHVREPGLPSHRGGEPVVNAGVGRDESRTARLWEPRPSRGYRVFQAVNVLALLGVVVVTLYPFVNIIAQSFSAESYIVSGQVDLVPRGFNLTTYRIVLSDPMFWINYRNTVVYTIVGTAISMFLTTCYAYVLSKKQLRGRRVLIWIAVFTLFFNGGLIPNYILVTSLGMTDTIWAIVVPNAISVFNLLVMKSFFENMPPELEEAAAVDGLDTYRILLRIVMPLSKAVLATMALFYAVAFWNSWFSAFLYMDNQGLFTVTVYLRNIIESATSLANIQQSSDTQLQIAANIQAVTVVLVAVPILCVYPYVQRYFVSGVMLGAVKG